jgi:hypothetical protein
MKIDKVIHDKIKCNCLCANCAPSTPQKSKRQKNKRNGSGQSSRTTPPFEVSQSANSNSFFGAPTSAIPTPEAPPSAGARHQKITDRNRLITNPKIGWGGTRDAHPNCGSNLIIGAGSGATVWGPEKRLGKWGNGGAAG